MIDQDFMERLGALLTAFERGEIPRAERGEEYHSMWLVPRWVSIDYLGYDDYPWPGAADIRTYGTTHTFGVDGEDVEGTDPHTVVIRFPDPQYVRHEPRSNVWAYTTGVQAYIGPGFWFADTWLHMCYGMADPPASRTNAGWVTMVDQEFGGVKVFDSIFSLGLPTTDRPTFSEVGDTEDGRHHWATIVQGSSTTGPYLIGTSNRLQITSAITGYPVDVGVTRLMVWQAGELGFEGDPDSEPIKDLILASSYRQPGLSRNMWVFGAGSIASFAEVDGASFDDGRFYYLADGLGGISVLATQLGSFTFGSIRGRASFGSRV